MTFDDLLNIPYKEHGRDKNGYDCYGLVIECCARTGTPLVDLYGMKDLVPPELQNNYIYAGMMYAGLNLERIDRPDKYCVAEMEYNGHLHMGFMLDRDTVLQTTTEGVHTAPAGMCRIKNFYRVTKI